jgi:hypothetical protein
MISRIDVRVGVSLHFDEALTDLDFYNAESRGYLGNVSLILNEKKIAKLCFYDTTRFMQDVETTIDNGAPCFYDGAAVIISRVTVADLKKAAAHLVDKKLIIQNSTGSASI